MTEKSKLWGRAARDGVWHICTMADLPSEAFIECGKEKIEISLFETTSRLPGLPGDEACGTCVGPYSFIKGLTSFHNALASAGWDTVVEAEVEEPPFTEDDVEVAALRMRTVVSGGQMSLSEARTIAREVLRAFFEHRALPGVHTMKLPKNFW